MRLDHLLSKEHADRPGGWWPHRPRDRGAPLSRWWVFCSWVEYQQADTDTTHTGTLPAWMVGGGVCGVRGGTLLGCRSTSYVGWFPGTLTHPLWWVCGVGGLLFVNYIVDASIFDAACIWSHDDHGRGVFGFLVVVVWWVCVVCSLMIVLCCVA